MLEFDHNRPNYLKKVWGDRRRYVQILTNFLSNALKFTNKKGMVSITFILLEEVDNISSNGEVPRTNSLQDSSQSRHLDQPEYYIEKYIKLRIDI